MQISFPKLDRSMIPQHITLVIVVLAETINASKQEKHPENPKHQCLAWTYSRTTGKVRFISGGVLLVNFIVDHSML